MSISVPEQGDSRRGLSTDAQSAKRSEARSIGLEQFHADKKNEDRFLVRSSRMKKPGTRMNSGPVASVSLNCLCDRRLDTGIEIRQHGP